MDLSDPALPSWPSPHELVDFTDLRNYAPCLLAQFPSICVAADLTGLFVGIRIEHRPDRSRKNTTSASTQPFPCLNIARTSPPISKTNRHVYGQNLGLGVEVKNSIYLPENVRLDASGGQVLD